MSRDFGAAMALFATLQLSAPALAWDGFGHMEVAAVAWEQLTPQAKAQAITLIGRLIHPARFDIRSARSTFEPGDLVALRRNCPPQFSHLFQQLQHQALQIGV